MAKPTSAGGDRRAGDHVAAVGAVGDAPGRELRDRAGDDGDRHHQRDQRRRQPDPRSPDGGERAEGAVDDADEEARSGTRPASCAKSFRRSILTRVSGRGEAAVESAVGRIARREEDRARHEERRRGGVADADAELAGGDAEIGHHQVDGEDRAAALVGDALVQPALDDHEGAGDEEAGAGAQEDPGERDRRRARSGG